MHDELVTKPPSVTEFARWVALPMESVKFTCDPFSRYESHARSVGLGTSVELSRVPMPSARNTFAKPSFASPGAYFLPVSSTHDGSGRLSHFKCGVV